MQLWRREDATHRRARSALWQAYHHPQARAEPLLPLDPGLYEVAPWFLHGADFPPDAREHTSDALTIVHILGTGENLYSPLTGLRLMCQADTRLRAFRHVIVDTPHDAAGYLGPAEFGSRVRRSLAPLLAREQRRLVIVGLSRGALSALDLGADVVSTVGMRVGILALAPPLAKPHALPATVYTIGALEPIMENLLQLLAAAPWLGSCANWITRRMYVRFSAFVLVELRMVDPTALELFARFVRQTDPKQACLRAVREFSLLCRVSDAELRHAVSGVLQRLAFCETAHAIVCWGDADRWVPVERSRDRLLEKLAQQAVPRTRVEVNILPGLGHGLSREPAYDYAQLAACLWRVVEHANARDVRDQGMRMGGLS